MPSQDYYFQPEKDREFKRLERNGNQYRITFTRSGISETISRFNLLHTHDAGETWVGIFWKLKAHSPAYDGFIHVPHKTDQYYHGTSRDSVLNWLLDSYEEWLEEQHNLAYAKE